MMVFRVVLMMLVLPLFMFQTGGFSVRQPGGKASQPSLDAKQAIVSNDRLNLAAEL